MRKLKSLTALASSIPLYASLANADVTRSLGEQYVVEELQAVYPNAKPDLTVYVSQPNPPLNNEEFRFAVVARRQDDANLCIDLLAIDYMATNGPEPENKANLKPQILNMGYTNIPSQIDEASIRQATRDAIDFYCQTTSSPVQKESTWGRVKATYR